MNTATQLQLQLLERCKYEIEFASGVFLREDHGVLIKDIEAYLSKQQVEQEPIYTTGAPLIFAIKLINSDLTLIENIKTREDLNVVIKSIRDQLQAISAYANKIITPSPQTREQSAAIKTLEHLGYTYHGGEQWKPPLGKEVK